VPEPEMPMNKGIGADADPEKHEPKPLDKSYKPSPALSMVQNPTVTDTIETRQVAFLCADGFSEKSVSTLKKALEAKGAAARIIGPHAGYLKGDAGTEIKTDYAYFSSSSVLFDAIYIPMVTGTDMRKDNDNVIEFVNDAYRHCKVIGFDEGVEALIEKTTIGNKLADHKDSGLPGVIIRSGAAKAFTDAFTKELGRHRIWEREPKVVE
jgi:catalase